MRGWLVGSAVALMLAGCAMPPAPMPTGAPVAMTGQMALTPQQAAENFVYVVQKLEPEAEKVCRERTRNVPCRFQIAVDDRMDQVPNAYQTLDARGQPVLIFTLPLILETRNPDELAFIMGHEAAHHILGHMERQQQAAMVGAEWAGTLASLGGATPEDIKQAQDMGAEVGARRFSKDYELEADALGTEIAWRAGFDPRLGAQFFMRIPDPGNRFLGSHPPNAQRLRVVEDTLAGLQ